MARTRSRSGGRGGARTVALAVAVVIAIASTAAVVISDDPQTLRLAVVGALWAFVLAAFAAPRRRPAEEEDRPGTELELRRTYEIELEREVAARREYELQLEVYLRRELERGLAEDVAALRDEVGRMRGEMMDRLDGELRMERIQTTRLIGGSLRALQDEARRLGIGLDVPGELTAGSIFDEPPAPAPPAYEYGGSTPSAYPAHPSYPDPEPPAEAGPPRPYVPPAPAYPATPATPPGPAYPAGPPYPAGSAAPPGPAYPTGSAHPVGSAYPAGSAYPTSSAHPAPPAFGPEPGRPDPEPARAEPARQPPPPREPPTGESVPRRRRAREDGEDNEVLSRLLGR